ncbi:putative C2H2-type zinc finger protein [Lyophyllum shimeji]|uniref:C2H2-type zinc finger protein n=1 Tax=Lyophyllum shimeji TaxID=47721 RepID=A0A9P3PCN1_LYOSH|nr:putative C2H2-type zinc finger protein [Lyophyllum shimeji]
MMSPLKSSTVLPSIHEMFPEHLMRDPNHARTAGPHSQHHLTSPLLPHGSVYHSPGPSYSSPSSNKRHSAAADSSHARLPYLPHTPASPSKTRRPTSPSYHLVCRDHHRNLETQAPRAQSDSPIFSFNVLRSDPSSSSLQHIASSATFPNRGGSSAGYSSQCEVSNGSAPVFRVSVPNGNREPRGVGNTLPHRSQSGPTNAARKFGSAGPHTLSSPGPGYSAIISFPVSGPMTNSQARRPHSPDDPETISDGDLSGSNTGKKHVCPTCSKRFNRPSSLRIHVNTHTGATPFRCPWPNCGREFNVNSNMRRHYRNHTTPGISRPQSNDNGRRRKRGPSQSLVFVPGDPRSDSRDAGPSMAPPISSLSMNEDSDISEAEEEDELDSLPDEASPTYENSPRLWSRSSEPFGKASDDRRNSLSRYSQSHLRAANPAAASHSNSSSSSGSPLQDHMYSPSAPYSRSFADAKVSTALRPAFSMGTYREEPMSDVR